MENFRQRMEEKIRQKHSVTCVGLDPDMESPQFPAFLKEEKNPKREFAKQLIDAVADFIPVIKPNTRFYDPREWQDLVEIVKYAHKHDLEVIGDCKENDIGSTMALAYRNQFGTYDFDALTVNGYLGSDGIMGMGSEDLFKPWFNQGKGLFVLVKTSNPSSADLQDKILDLPEKKQPVYAAMASLVEAWSQHYDHTIGAVVGATHPDQLVEIRELLEGIILAPGYGAQGGTAEAIGNILKPNRYCLVNSSRGVMYAYDRRFKGKYSENDFATAAREEVQLMNSELGKYLDQVL